MENPLAALKTNKSVEKDTDTLGGFELLNSGTYKMKVKYAFTTTEKSKAIAMNLHLEGENGSKLRGTMYMTSGEKKGCKNTYTKNAGKDNESTHYLPGFSQANALCRLATGEEVADQPMKKMTINIYNPELGKEAPTEVDMFEDLLGQNIIVGVLKKLIDKTEKNSDTGDYEPNGETREINEIEKFFCAKEGYENLTINELEAGVEEPVFIGDWTKRWEGKVKDETSKDAPKSGAPKREAGKQAPKKSLFGNKS